MIEASELLSSYVEGIRDLCGAGSVTLFVPAPLSGLSEPTLLHSGNADPLGELTDLETAMEFLTRIEKRRSSGALNGSGGPVTIQAKEPEGVLIGLPSVEYLWSDSSEFSRREGDSPDSARAPAAWLGMRFKPGDEGQERMVESHLPAKLSTGEARSWWNWLFAMGGALASHTNQVASIFRDPLTGLPDRAGFQAILSEELEKARLKKRPLSLLLVNPDDFIAVNEHLGREAGDRVVREISSRLRASVRGTDPVTRYGGVIFAVVLLGTPADEVRAVAEKILHNLAEGSFLDGAVRLGFSIGTVAFDPEATEAESPIELIRRADQALNTAKRHGGGCIAEWEHGSVTAENGAFDRLSGIFTGNMAKDYRNMVLLSDALDVISVHQDFEGLATAAVERIYSTFKPDRSGLFARDDEGELVLVHGLTRVVEPTSQQRRLETVELGPQLDDRIRLAAAAGEPCEERYSRSTGNDSDTEERICCVLPLNASGRSLGCLFLDGRQETLGLESSDLIFLKALASQLAVALDRLRLSEMERTRQEGEKKQLKAELNELRQALRQSKLVYRSPQVEQVVATARRVAPTDATVLITGESGTGKELLARTVHELSPRRHLPLVIVDCGAIATTLMESELFGHEKGAYTGAQGRRVGRLAEADGGTVLLDEIGELPLEVQSKLLRFVQEKQFTTVGGTRTRRVDVRILAATNRDLASEVQSGRFREDLYHRLNVVRLEVPPLRHRPDDVLHLSRHFVETFSVQYQKNIHRLTADAEQKLVAYSWPGNVRELQNRLMQAVILCEHEELDANDLMLPVERAAQQQPGVPVVQPPPLAVPSGLAANYREPAIASAPPMPYDPALPDPDQAWGQLRDFLGREIDLALGGISRTTLPLGKWLSDDLILEAHAASDGIARRGAALVGIPETTFRRRLGRASDQARAGLSPRSGTWSEVRSVLAEIVRADGDTEKDLLTEAERVLLEEIIHRVPNDTRTGSGLLGVTPPTYRGRLAQYSPGH
jgi:diguanylate cyclase (GGDEF)-like protein